MGARAVSSGACFRYRVADRRAKLTTAYETVSDYDTASPRDGRIKLHGPEGFEGMRKAGKLAASVLDMLTTEVEPGVSTEKLDRLTREFVFDHGATPATLFYRGYRHSLCTSINHVVCHGIPGPKPLKNGDIVNIDVTVVVDGWHGDTSRMYMVGEPKRKAELLVDTTYDAMMAGINAIKPGMFFTVEPMLNLGRPDVKILSDGWTAVTRDKTLSAQFEHSVGVTEDGVEIFTTSPKGLHKPPYSS